MDDSARTSIPQVLAPSPDDKVDISQYWNIESVGVHGRVNETNSFRIHSYIENCIKYEDGRYTAPLPSKPDHLDLPSNYNICAHITRKTVNTMNGERRSLYHKIICDQLDRGFIEVSPGTDVNNGHYLCHYGIKNASITTPLRIVYGCNFSTADKPSLNDCSVTWELGTWARATWGLCQHHH